MKHLFPIGLFLLLAIPAKAQIADPLLTDTMTISQAEFALKQQMSTISHCYFHDYYGSNITEAAEKYYRKFLYSCKPFKLLPKNEILAKINGGQDMLRTRFTFINRGEGARLMIANDFSVSDTNQDRLSDSYALPHRNVVKKVFYANGTVESNPKVLETKRWYQNRKPIDSLLVDATIVYPTASAVMKMSVFEAQKNDFETGGFIWLINNDGRRVSMAISQNISENVGSIQLVTTDGERKKSTLNSYLPQQPSSEMYAYASALYRHCESLLSGITQGICKTTASLLKIHAQSKPTLPAIQFIDRYSYLSTGKPDTLEVNYYTAMDSVLLSNQIVKAWSERKCDYGTASISTDTRILYGLVDLNGRWVVRPTNNDYNLFDEVAGIFYKEYSNDYSRKSASLLVVNKAKKKLESTPYKLFDLYDDTYLLVEKNDGKRGILHRGGKTILPAEYVNVKYHSHPIFFVAQLDTHPTTYKLFDASGKDLFPKVLIRSIAIKSDCVRVLDGQEKQKIFNFDMTEVLPTDYLRRKELLESNWE